MSEYEELMAVVARLTAQAEALAALGAGARSAAGEVTLEPAIADSLAAVAAELGVDPGALESWQATAAAGVVRAFFLQAADLLQHPEREPGWSYDDPAILRSQGRASGAVPELMRSVAPQLDGLDGARDFLDVGAGVGTLSITLCRLWPGARVVALEPWEPSRRLARDDVAAAGLGTQIELRAERVEDLADREAFDVVWFPLPFIAAAAVPAGLARCRAALRSGGWIVAGRYATPDDPLARRLADLRVIRSGGHPYEASEVEELLTAAGFESARALERTWNAPIEFVVGRA